MHKMAAIASHWAQSAMLALLWPQQFQASRIPSLGRAIKLNGRSPRMSSMKMGPLRPAMTVGSHKDPTSTPLVPLYSPQLLPLMSVLQTHSRVRLLTELNKVPVVDVSACVKSWLKMIAPLWKIRWRNKLSMMQIMRLIAIMALKCKSPVKVVLEIL